MALPLIEQGHDVHLIAQVTPSYYEYYKSMSFAAGVGQYIEAFKQHADTADIFHVHNEPSWYVSAIKETVDKPVILDIHDSYAARTTIEEEAELRHQGKDVTRIFVEERTNFQLADGLVFPGEVFADLVKKEFGLEQPSLTLPSYCPKRLYAYSGEGWLGGLVYEGRIDMPEKIASRDYLHGFRYCDYLELAQKAHEIGLGFHIYTSNKSESFIEAYDEISYLHEPRPIESLINGIGRHDWGLVGNIFPTPEWDVAFPNKMFEYIAANVPICVMNAGACAEFVEKHGIGIVVNSLKELMDRWDESVEIRKNMIKKRQTWCMDRHIDKLVDLYEEVIDG